MHSELITLTITDLSRSGAGVARAGETVVFVTGALPGETVRARITEKQKRFWTATTEEILTASPERQTPRCPVFGKCGGCDLQHMPYSMQWELKFKGLKHGLTRVGLETWAHASDLWQAYPAADVWNYRNRVQLRGEGSEIGYYARGSKVRVAITHCDIARPEINAQLSRVRMEGAKRAAEYSGEYSGEYKVEIEVLPTGQTREMWNQPHGKAGFRQVNDAQNARLVGFVSEAFAGESGVLLDLYGGSGNLSEALRTQMKRVYVVDVGAPRNIAQGFHGQPVDRWLTQNSRGMTADHAILDPPREGLGAPAEQILANIARMGVRRVVHVGCDPDAWARDLRRFHDAGWRAERLAGFDFFPQTKHIEAAALLVKKPQ